VLSATAGAAAVAVVIGVAAWAQLRTPKATRIPSAPSELPAAPPVEPAVAHVEPTARAETPEPEPEPRRPERVLDPGALSKKKPALSDGVREALDAAERALDQGQPADALRLARGSLRDGASERAYALMARAYCAQRDLGMVQAMLRNLSSAQRKQVKTQCARAGLELN
jgi:hypothetical protein